MYSPHKTRQPHHRPVSWKPPNAKINKPIASALQYQPVCVCVCVCVCLCSVTVIQRHLFLKFISIFMPSYGCPFDNFCSYISGNKNAHRMCTAMDPRLSYNRTHTEWGGFWNNNRQGYLHGTGWVEHSLTHWQERPVPVQHEWTKGHANSPLPNRNTASLLFVTCSSTIFPRSFSPCLTVVSVCPPASILKSLKNVNKWIYTLQ